MSRSSACRAKVGCLYLAGHHGECVTGVLRRFATIPMEPWHEIAAGLYQGSGHTPISIREFDSVLTLYKRAAPVDDNVRHRQWFFDDTDAMPDEEQLGEAIDWVRKAWLDRGERTLIRCQAGLNRSGLVVAATLINVIGGDPDEVIRLIRTRRDVYALCNPTFESYLRGL